MALLSQHLHAAGQSIPYSKEQETVLVYCSLGDRQLCYTEQKVAKQQNHLLLLFFTFLFFLLLFFKQAGSKLLTLSWGNLWNPQSVMLKWNVCTCFKLLIWPHLSMCFSRQQLPAGFLPPPEVHSGAFEAALFSTFQSGLNIHSMYIEQYLQLERPSSSIRQNVGANTLTDSSRLWQYS